MGQTKRRTFFLGRCDSLDIDPIFQNFDSLEFVFLGGIKIPKCWDILSISPEKWISPEIINTSNNNANNNSSNSTNSSSSNSVSKYVNNTSVMKKRNICSTNNNRTHKHNRCHPTKWEKLSS